MSIEMSENELLEKAKELRAKAFAHAGEMVQDKCPICQKKLMRNWLKHEWCSNFDCDYFVRNNGTVSAQRIKQLNFKYSKSE